MSHPRPQFISSSNPPHSLLWKKKSQSQVSYLTSCSKMPSFWYLLKGEEHFCILSLTLATKHVGQEDNQHINCLNGSHFLSLCNPNLEEQCSRSWTRAGELAFPEESVMIKGFSKPVQTELAFSCGCVHPRMSQWASTDHPRNVRHASSLGSPAHCDICSSPWIMFKQAMG